MEDRQSRLPEYVGKKIVEALKQDQHDNEVLEADNTPVYTEQVKAETTPAINTVETKVV